MGVRPEVARFVIAAVAAVFWLWFVSHGFQADGILDGYYELYAESLLQGRLSLGPGPFGLFIHDALIHSGQCYSIYGLVPSIVFIVLKPLIGRLLAHYLIVFGFFFALVFFFQKLIAEVIEASGRWESEPRTLVKLSSMVLGCFLLFFVPLPGLSNWFFGRFIIYEQQVVFSQALVMAGAYYLVRAVQSRRSDVLALASVLFAVAGWTKITWYPAAAMCTAIGVYLTLRSGWSAKTPRARVMTALGLTLSAVLISGRLLLNLEQFGSVADFGQFYQDPSSWEYLRTLAPFFSPLTRLGNAAFNMLSFYGSPKLASISAIWEHSLSSWEGLAPCFFAVNPWFLPVAVLMPVGLYLAKKRRPAMFRALLVVLGMTLYINGVMAVFGLVVTKRYFMEGYYFLVLVLFGTMLVFMRLRYAVVLLLVLIGLNAKTTVCGMLTVQPELRVINVAQDYAVTSDPGATPFLVRNGNWPREFVSGANLRHASRCAVMGMRPDRGGQISAMDVCAVYLSLEAGPAEETPVRVILRRARSVGGAGRWVVLVEDHTVGSVALDGETAVDASFELPFPLKREAPYRVLCVFLPNQDRHLSGRPSGNPVVTLREISLEPHTEVLTSSQF